MDNPKTVKPKWPNNPLLFPQMIESAAAQVLYEVNIYVELEYPDVVDLNGNEGSGRFEQDLPDWNIIFLTDLDETSSVDDLLAYASRRFPDDINQFIKEHKNAIFDNSFQMESHDPQEDGAYNLDDDEILFNENCCVWEAYSDDWVQEVDWLIWGNGYLSYCPLFYT